MTGEVNEVEGTGAPGADAESQDGPVVIEAETVEPEPEPEPETVEPERVRDDNSRDDGPAAPAPVRRRGGFFPTVLGGAVAAGLGFAAAGLMPGGWLAGGADDTAAVIAANSARIEEVAQTLEALPVPEAPDLSGLEGGLAEARATVGELRGEIEALRLGLEGRVTDLGAELASFSDRLRRLEEQPERGDGSAARAAAAEAELSEFRGQLQSLIAEAERKIADADARAAEIEQAAEQAAAEAEVEAKLAELRAAVESGAPFAELLSDLSAMPEALAVDAAKGVPTLVSLQQEFPAAARAALAATQTVSTDASATERFTAFLRRQTNARSLTPQEGGSADAILSRAEAALDTGDLETALAELSALPEPSQRAMSDWLARAHARQAALAAVTEITTARN